MLSDEAQQAEALQALSTVVQFEKQQLRHDDAGDDAAAAAAAAADDDDDDDAGHRDGDGVNVQSSEALAGAYHTLSMLHYLLHNNDMVMIDMSHVTCDFCV